MTRFELLVGADAFWRRAQADFAAARRRLYVQAMTFEGDAVGQAVAGAIAAAPAADRRVLVDAYSLHVVSDRFVHGPAWLDPAFRAEVRATHAMFGALARGGVGVRVTNPFGPLLFRAPARNHKKLIVSDDVAYIGGVNFSQHNFAWHDFMLRMEGAAVADILAADFEATFAGRPQAWSRQLPGLRLISLDGRTNASGFAEVMAMVEGARTSVDVITPYLTFPFTDALAAARAKGVAVRLITPLANNKRLLRDYLLRAARVADFEVRLTPQMSHLKGLVIDGKRLVVGSSNFDVVSLAAEEELVAVIDTPQVVAQFEAEVVAPALATALPANTFRPPAWSELAGRALVSGVAAAARLTRDVRRTAVDWR